MKASDLRVGGRGSFHHRWRPDRFKVKGEGGACTGLAVAADAAADKAYFDDEGEERLREVLGWEFLTDEAVEELAAEELGADETPPPPAVTPTMVVVVEFKKKSMRELKDVAALVNVAQGGAKRALFDRVCLQTAKQVQNYQVHYL